MQIAAKTALRFLIISVTAGVGSCLVAGVTAVAAEKKAAPQEKTVILTPKPPATPKINGAKVFGVRPGHPFLFTIAATGHRPMDFAVDRLPKGLQVDSQTGQITGSIKDRGEYIVTFRAKNALGQAERPFKIVCGDTLALTPPMGWSNWYADYNRVTDKVIREAADAMVKNGMANVGYQYVTLDDCWSNAAKNPDPKRVGPPRDSQGNILTNQYFPDMKAMTDYIHARGLKAGIYSSPGPVTCQGFAASGKHEAQDAKQFADWGFDLLMYDWCSYGGIHSKDIEFLKRPYKLMGGLLKQQNRDIQFNICQYGMGDVWKWGAEVGGQSWRTAFDIGYDLNRVAEVALKNASHWEYSKPGSWNDPDNIIIGYYGKGPCRMTPTEQYAYMSYWCLMAAPLSYGGDMIRLDEFTLNVLCNPEVIEIDQDTLGECAHVVPLSERTFLMVKRLDDGGTAVGLCNRGEGNVEVTAKWSDLGLTGKKIVRDLWRQKDLGTFDNQFSASIGRHGVVLLRLRAEEQQP
jgi:alpha-galactosidase